MSTLSPQVIAALDAGVVRAGMLLWFHLETGDFLVWSGAGDLYALGQTWRGAGSVGRLPEIEQLMNGQASRMTIEISGVSQEAIASMIDEAADIEGRELDFYLALFDANSQLIGDPIFLTNGLMDEVSLEQVSDGDTVTRKISLDVASPFAGRSTAPLAYYTHQDQVARSPTDLGCDRVGSYQSRTIGWPRYG